jgi:hypothetical protein
VSATRTDRHDLNDGTGGSVDNPKPADPTTAQAGQFVAEQFADCGIVDDVAQGPANLTLQVRVEASDQRPDVVGDS